MREQSGFQLSGSAPAMYEHYIVPAISAAFAQELVTLTALTTGERILDAACGTGVVTRQAAQAVGLPGEVIGLDVNAGMLHMARTLPSPAGVSITYREGSVMALPFPTATFDVVLCQNGLEFFPDRSRSLQEIGRVLTPGGRLGLRVWRALEYQTFHRTVFAALDRYLWGGQAVPSRLSAFQPFGLWNAKDLRTLVGDAGFCDIDVRVSRVPIRLAADTAAILGYLSALPIGSEIAAMAETTRTVMLHEVMAAFQPCIDASGFVLPAESHVVLARR